jgi:hypothetical protein
MRANEFILERVTGTIDPRTGDVDMVNQRTGKMTQLRKDTRTDIDDEGTKVYRGGTLRSVSTPKIGGLQATQTFRPDSTPGYQQVDYETGGLSVSAKGSPETGYDQSARLKMGGMDIGTTQKYSGQKSMDIGYQVRPGTKISATSKISKPGAKPVTKMSLTQSQFNEFGPAERVVTVGGTTVRANSRTGKVSANTKIGNTNLSVDNTLNKDGSSGKMSAATKIGNTTATYNTNKSGQQSLNVSSNLGNNKTISATSNIAKPGAKPVNKMSLTQSQFEDVQAAIREHVAKNVPFTECMFRAGSPAFTEFYRQVREVADKLNLDWQDQELLNTDIGECIMVEGELVPLDVPMEELELDEAEYQGRKVKLNSPKRGGSKKFYVYVKNPKTGRVKKISWGDTTGLSVKAKDRGAVRSFVARHKCKQANDKMTARYWSCRTPRYKALGVKGGQWW